MTKPKIDFKKLAKRVRDRNYRFRKMTPEQQRVRIAKDVIDNLRASKIVAANDGYLNLRENPFEAKDNILSLEYDLCSASRSERRRIETKIEALRETLETPLHQVFESNKGCTVCAIGGAFVSAVLRADCLKVKDLNDTGDSDAMRDYLGQWFDRKQLGLIESAFEKSVRYAMLHGGSTYVKANEASEFGQKYADPEDRMIAIMQNIVENKGEFRP